MWDLVNLAWNDLNVLHTCMYTKMYIVYFEHLCTIFFVNLQVKTPKPSQLKKYGNPRQRMILQVDQIQLYGRQILEVGRTMCSAGATVSYIHNQICRLLTWK